MQQSLYHNKQEFTKGLGGNTLKRLIATAAAVLLSTTLSYHAFAHSNFGESTPADGQVVTEPLNEITIQFDGQIEQGSFIEVTTSSGQAVELQDIIAGDGILTGTIAEPLPNNDYHVNWSIISADGHPLDGEFSFTVNVPAAEIKEEVPKEATGALEETTEATNKSNEAQEEAVADEVKEDSSPATMIIVVLFILIVAGALFFFNKKRK